MTNKEIIEIIFNEGEKEDLRKKINKLYQLLKKPATRGELEQIGCIFYRKNGKEQAYLNIKPLIKYPYYWTLNKEDNLYYTN